MNDLPTQGFVFWPVGTGDSTTISVNQNTVVQIDLHHMCKADDESDPCYPVVDELIRLLPKRAGRPYLATFVLTHPDEDHCAGFADLLNKVTIGELWFSPRVFLEYKKDLCDDAKAFQAEAKRRVTATVRAKGAPASGDRVRVIGYHELLEENDFRGFPESRLVVPGHEITIIDDEDCFAEFRAFVHAPFKTDVYSDRNDSSIGLQVSLIKGTRRYRAMLLGDLCYPTIKRIFDISQADDLVWDIWLAPHHCSKSVMYWQDAGDKDEVLQRDLLRKIENAATSTGCIISSSCPIPATNKPGDNPPHAKAKARYEEICPTDFLCTMECPNETSPEPLRFDVTTAGLDRNISKSSNLATAAALRSAVVTARGSDEPPKDRVGFGA